MIYHSNRAFRDEVEVDYYHERLEEILTDGRLADDQAEECAWASVLFRRERLDRDE